VKDIMIAGDTLGYTVRGNTGWGEMDGLDIGWYVGYLESDSRVYYFANCIQSAKPDNPHFAPARIAILYSILGEVQGKKDSN
jgi:beta-lactamase class D